MYCETENTKVKQQVKMSSQSKLLSELWLVLKNLSLRGHSLTMYLHRNSFLEGPCQRLISSSFIATRSFPFSFPFSLFSPVPPCFGGAFKAIFFPFMENDSATANAPAAMPNVKPFRRAVTIATKACTLTSGVSLSSNIRPPATWLSPAPPPCSLRGWSYISHSATGSSISYWSLVGQG